MKSRKNAPGDRGHCKLCQEVHTILVFVVSSNYWHQLKYWGIWYKSWSDLLPFAINTWNNSIFQKSLQNTNSIKPLHVVGNTGVSLKILIYITAKLIHALIVTLITLTHPFVSPLSWFHKYLPSSCSYWSSISPRRRSFISAVSLANSCSSPVSSQSHPCSSQ